MANYVVAGQELTDRYLTDTDIIDRYIGNQWWAWGSNVNGQLGTNDTTHRSSPVQTVSGGTNWTQIGSNIAQFTAGIKTDGSLWLWGLNGWGQLGNNTTTSASSPVQTVSAGTDWKQVSCSQGGVNSIHTAAIKTDGSLWTWGVNTDGQLGDNTTTNKSSPVQTVSATKSWEQVSSGGNTTAAIKADGTLWVWGQNTNGLLGDGTQTAKSSPVQTVAAGTNWKQVSASLQSTAGIKTDGTLWMWGQNTYGQLGTNDLVHRSSPVQTVAGGTNWKQVATAIFTTAAVKTDGTLWSWGANGIGQLGDNTQTHRSSPVQTISAGTNWKQASVSAYITAAVKTDGTLWLWGSNNVGGLGTNDLVHRSSPVQTVAGGTNWKQVAVGTSTGFNTAAAAITFAES